MSSGQGDNISAKADDDTETKSPNKADKLVSKDQVDHASNSSLDKHEKLFLELLTEDTSNKTDSGFKDNLLSDIVDKTKSFSDDNSDDDLELKWEDDENDEQNATPLENIETTNEPAPKVPQPMDVDIDDTNLSGSDTINEKTDEINENKLLESSLSNNEDNLFSTSDLAKTNLPLCEDENEAICKDIEDTIDENQLLEGPESDIVDEDKLLEISDETKEESFSNDDLTKNDSNIIKAMPERSENVAVADNLVVSSTIENATKIDIAKETTCPDSKDKISKDYLCNKKLDLESTKLVHSENNIKVVSDLESTSPIQDKSQMVLAQSPPNDSLMDKTLDINTEHGLNKPDMMLEIPTQEIIELIDDTDISISANDDDKIEVDSVNDSSKTNPIENIDVAEVKKKLTLEEKADEVILKPADVFRALNSQKPSRDGSNETKNVEDVSEDDWCEIERRLEGFEDSVNEESQPNEQLNIKEKENIKNSQSKDDISSENIASKLETLPLTKAQKLVIESENKELLKTLLDTSKLDFTQEEMSNKMDVEEELTPNPDIEGQLTESPLESIQDANKADIGPETDLPSDLDKTEKVTQLNNEKEIEKLSVLENINQESLKPDTKSKNVDSKPMSPFKLTEAMEVHVETTNEELKSSKRDTKVSTDVSSYIKVKPIESLKTLKVDKTTKLKDEVKSSEIKVPQTNLTEKVVVPLSEPMEVQASTKQSDDKVISSTLVDKSVGEKSPSKPIDDDLESGTSMFSIKEKTIDKIDKKFTDDVESSTSELPIEDKIKPSTPTHVPQSGPKSIYDKEVSPSTENESKNEDQTSTNEAQLTTLLESTSKPDSEVPSTEQSSNIEVQSSASEMIVEQSTNKVQSSVDDISSTLKCDNKLPLSSKTSDKMDVQPSTSNVPDNIKVPPSSTKILDDNKIQPLTSKVPDDMEVQPSTSKVVDTEVQPSTAQVTDDIEVQPSNSKVVDMEVQPSISKVADIEVQPSTSKVVDTKIQPSTTKVPNDIEVQPTTLKIPDAIEVQPSTSKVVDMEVQPSTSKVVDMEVQPSTSKVPDIEVQPTTEVPSSSVEPNTDPDSDDVAETSDSLGLLAESSRVMEDDDEQDEDDDADGDDDDYDPEDESSNQMTAEHSEDSNAPHSETDQAKDEKEIESPLEEKREDEFSFITTEDKDGAIADEKDSSMDVDTEIVQDDIEVTTEQVGNEVPTDDVEATESTDTAAPKLGDKTKAKQTDAEKVKQSESSTKETESESMLRKLLAKREDETNINTAKSPSKKLGFAQQSHVLNIVDLEESSSEDDIQEVKKAATADGTLITFDGFKITIPNSVDVSSVPVEPPEVACEETVVTEDKSDDTTAKGDSKASEDKPKPKFSLEIFSLDSDEEDSASAPVTEQKGLTKVELDKAKEPNKCINISCTSSGNVLYYRADAATISYYDAAKRRKPLVCHNCADLVVMRTERLVKGIKDLTPLLDLDTCKLSSELVEISDSESEDEADTSDEPRETLGETGASFLEANLAMMINETWTKFRLDSRLTEAQDDLNKELEKLDAESKEIDAMLTECQVATDKLRNDLYATFEQQRRDIGAIIIVDTPVSKYSCIEKEQAQTESAPETRAKRRMSSASETPAKRPAIPLGYAPLDSDTAQAQENKLPTVENTKAEDDKDISVLKVSAEAAPSDLPPPGELVRPPLRAGMCVYAMRNAFGSWLRTRILEVDGKSAVLGMSQTFTVCRIKYEHKPKGSTKLSPARCLAYSEPATVRLTIGTRVIALFKDSQNPLKKDAFYSGIISEVPNPVNNYRYLVFFDDGYAQYVQHRDTRVVCESSSLVWEEVHPYSREFVREYLLAYPERPMVRLHAGQSLKTEWNGKWWTSRVIQVDASLVQVHFEKDNRSEWIYRGSTRLAPLFLELRAAERHRARPMPRTKAQPRLNMPYVEYTRSDEQSKAEQPAPQAQPISDKEIRQRAVAKKSTAMPPAPNIPPPSADSVTSRVVYYTPKNAVKPYNMTAHSCGPQCKRKDVLALKDLRTYNPLAKPLLSGWERQIVRYKGHKEVMYRAPCGRRLRSMRELHRYLRLVHSDMCVDLFDFTPHTHCLAEFVLNKCLVGKKDLSHGKENVPVPCVNYYDESLPEFCSYNTERTPTAGVPLNLDPAFLCGCDCTDDCEDKSKCACWQMTLEGARTIGLGGPNVGYKYKRLPEPLPSGIYECNSRCKCKHTCLNRVAQHPLQLKLQVFKTLNRGWGIRALNDIPKGSFLCVYAGNLLTDATANMDGLNEGDEYLAELDYIEVVEQMKEGYEEDIPDADKRLDKKGAANASEESEMSTSEEEDDAPSKDEQEDGDFCPGYIGMGVSEFSKRLRKRDKSKKKNKQDGGAKEKEKDGDKTGDDFITISDDEEVREPSRFMAQAGMGKEFISKYRSVRSYFGKDEACYIMDAKVQGNIGRYLNHSCQPNVFVQNVFVDTHDPRFPWVAFFALSHIKAGTELTWNYNYDVGSVPGKVLYCYCGAPNCRGRLL